MSTRRNVSVCLILALLSSIWISQGALAEGIHWRSSLDEAKIEAGRTGKLVLLHFWTPSCGPCKKLDRNVYSQPQIGIAMEKDFVPVKINADVSPALANAYQISRVPSEVVLTSQGSVVTKLSCPLEPAAYASQLANVSQHYRQTVNKTTGSAQPTVNRAYAGLQIGQYNRQSVTPATAQTQPVATAPAVPHVTQNPYVTAPPQQPAAQPAAVQVAVPANAMPNSYRDRYAAAPAAAKAPVIQVPVTPPASPPVAAAPPITPTATAPAPMKAAQTTSPQVASVAPVAPAVAKPVWPPQLPPNTPPLAFDGYCPVSLKSAKKWVQGNQQFGAIHRGRTYLFTGDPERQQFLANPDAYSPVFAGKDPVKLLDENQTVDGSRKFGFEYRGAFYLFASKATMTRFESEPDRYAAGVRQAMNRMDAGGGGTLRR